MFTLIEGLPSDILAIEASGKVTHEDYRDVLIPHAEAMMHVGPIKLLYVLGGKFDGFELEALWDDGTFGIKHWRDFARIAVVGDQNWLHAAIGLFKPFFPCEVRLFVQSDLTSAKAWISA